MLNPKIILEYVSAGVDKVPKMPINAYYQSITHFLCPLLPDFTPMMSIIWYTKKNLGLLKPQKNMHFKDIIMFRFCMCKY